MPERSSPLTTYPQWRAKYLRDCSIAGAVALSSVEIRSGSSSGTRSRQPPHLPDAETVVTTASPSAVVRQQIAMNIAVRGYCIYRLAGGCSGEESSDVLRLAHTLGMGRLHVPPLADVPILTRIEHRPDVVRGAAYIPYSNRALGWHTDGYYNDAEPLRSFVLHCIRPAARGGINQLLDPRLVYMTLRDRAPDAAVILGTPVMHIPENRRDVDVARLAVTVPIFCTADDGELVMRYTRRGRHIEWRGGPRVIDAITALNDIVDELAEQAPSHRLEAGEGILCNNILHCRQSFEDDEDQGRLLLRGRFTEPLMRYSKSST
jgi:hypothetical protein